MFLLMLLLAGQPSLDVVAPTVTQPADTEVVANRHTPGTPTPALPKRLDGSTDWAAVIRQSAEADTVQQRRTRAIEYSDGYYRRLSVHRAFSYAMLPLFAGSYLTGTALFDGEAPDWVRRSHRPLAIATGVVFSVNTVTGILNLIESNKTPEGRTRRWVHGIAMIVADAGFTYAGAVLGPRAKADPTRRDTHRAVALSSIGLSVASWSFMLLTN